MRTIRPGDRIFVNDRGLAIPGRSPPTCGVLGSLSGPLAADPSLGVNATDDRIAACMNTR